MNEKVSLTEKDLDVLMDISQIALQNVTASLHALLKDEVIVKKSTFGVEDVIEDINRYTSSESEYRILFTEIVGNVHGKTYIILDPSSEEKICNHLLPNSVAGQIEMREGVALEFDNILIAALITKFSNLLSESNMHGHVPHYGREDISQLIEELKMPDSPFAFSVNLKSFKKGIKFKLIVAFDNSIINLMQSFSVDNSFVGKETEEAEDEKSVGNFFKKMFHI